MHSCCHFLVLGITGGIACGKSEVGRILEKREFEVCDADRVAHQLMKRGTSVYTQIVEAFGTEILHKNGEICRPELAKMVFGDTQKLNHLNHLVHPAVRKELSFWIKEQRRKKRCAAVLLPLLFESEMDDLDWDAIWTISASEEQVLDRLAKRGLSLKEARTRIEAQMPLQEKERRANFVIKNDGSLEILEEQIDYILEQTRAGMQ
jgi:dephospho-CoA kinase